MADPVQLRAWDGSHGAPDPFDADRIRLVRDRWASQDQALLSRDQTVEKNLRMLAGRQWDVWVPTLGTFVDPTRFMSDSEKRWRQRPVVNILAKWFLLTHARLTESTPVITFQPATADRLDQMLAETMDTVFKTLWTGRLDMDQRMADAAAWLVAAGEVYAETGVEYDESEASYHLTAPATLSLTAGDGSTIERDTSEPVPYGADGSPLAHLQPDEETGDYGYSVPADATPATVTEGCPVVRIYSPLEVRSEWGANLRWEDRRWIIVRRYLAPETVERLYGVKVQPDMTGAGDLSGSAGSLTRLLFGAGNFGAVGNATTTGEGSQPTVGYVTVDTMWEKPGEESPASDGNPGGRLLIVTPTQVLHDSIRPFQTQAAGPIRRAQFVQMPGRAGLGSTPLEQMVPLQQTYNRGWAQILEHRNRCSNPILMYDVDSGFDQQAQNVPGAMVPFDSGKQYGAQGPAYYLAPPPLSGDVWKTQQMVLDLLMTIGSMHGAEGEAPTEDPSGELISQLRFNADRPISVAARSLAMLLTGIADDLVPVLSVCWPAEKVLTYAGEDNVLRTTQVMPEMWSGRVNARPDLENALSETKGAQQAKWFRDWQAGAFGDPLTEGRKTYLALMSYPQQRGIGDVDRITCERFLTALSQGVPAQTLPMLPWYNYDAFLDVTRHHLAAPEFLNYEDPIKQQMGQFFEMILQARAASAQLQAEAQAPVVAAQAALQGHAQSAQAAHAPPAPDAAAGAPPTGPKGGPDATDAGPPSGAKAA